MTDREAFDAWWDSDKPELVDNPFRPDSAAYWAWAGWQVSSERAAKICEDSEDDDARLLHAAAIRKGEKTWLDT